MLSKLTNSIKEHLAQAAKPTLRCAFFAEPGFGKSYLLNYLLLGEDPMHCSTPNIQKSAASSGQGVTQKPVLFRLPTEAPCIKIKDMSGKETSSCDLAQATFEELPDKINDVLSSPDNDAELQMVVVEYDFPVLRNYSVELLDVRPSTHDPLGVCAACGTDAFFLMSRDMTASWLPRRQGPSPG